MRLILTILFLPMVWERPSLARNLTDDDVRDMSHTSGFCLGQTLSLDEIARRFPRLALSAAVASTEFNSAFGAAAAAIGNKLEEEAAAKWNEAREQMLATLKEKANFGSLTEAQAREFITTVRQRANGDMEDRALQTLLIWDPVHRKQPQSEFFKYKRKFVSTGDGKSKGIKVQFEYPASWASLEAERPNIVRKFISERGRGGEYAMIVVKALTPAERPSKRQVERAFSTPAGIRELLPPGATFINGKRIAFDSLPGAMVTFRMAADRMGEQFKMRTLMYVTFHRDCIISLQFSTVDDDATFTRFEPLFRLMANSAVIVSQWE